MHVSFAVVLAALVSAAQAIPLLLTAQFLLLSSVPALVFYAYLTDRAVFEGLGKVRSERLGGWDLFLAALLVAFFGYVVLQATRAGNPEDAVGLPDAGRIVAGLAGVAVLFLLFITTILAALRLREISWREAFGLARVGPAGIFWRAVLLLLLAYPLIALAANISEFFLKAGGDQENSTQELVRFFQQTDSGGARWAVAVSAMFIAPMQEEFLFRGYIYAVVKRYAGIVPGVLFNAALFALIHLHVPSFAPLFVLAVCLTLAYEWTGSIWVPMGMHALFNSLTVVSILLGGKDL